MRRTQLYLDEDIWKILTTRAREERTTISDLVRSAVREKYFSANANRKEAMLAAVGVWKDRSDLPDAETYLRNLRKDNRLKRLNK